jgi:hypothetical protein
MQFNRLWRRRAPICALASLAATFGFVATSSAQNASSLSGYVYIDRNNDGALTFNDQPDPEFVIPGVTIQLFSVDDMTLAETLVGTTVTDSVGKYQFGALDGGLFTLRQVQPVEYVDGQTTVGVIKDLMGVVDPMADVGTALLNAIVEIDLPDDSRGVLFNFGERGLNSAFVSKRFLLGTAPPLPTAEIPEPATTTLACMASLGALATMRRRYAPGAKA